MTARQVAHRLGHIAMHSSPSPQKPASEPSCATASLREANFYRVMRRLAIVVFLLQAIALLAISNYMRAHFALSIDYSIFEQARYLISHGTMDPYTTVSHFFYWQNHGEFIMWPLALISAVLLPNGMFLLALQDLSTAAAGLVAFLWVIDRLSVCRARLQVAIQMIALGTLIILIVNPWIYWSSIYDFHFQGTAALVLLLIARDLDRNRLRSSFVYVPILLSMGDVTGTYLVGLAISFALVRKLRHETLRPAIYIALVGVAWTAVLTLMHANQGSNLDLFYSYLAAGGQHATAPTKVSAASIGIGALLHPLRALAAIGHGLPNDWANAAPPGFLGVFSPWGMGISLMLFLSTNLIGKADLALSFSRPSFQSLPVYLFVPVGTAFVLSWGVEHKRRLVQLASLVLGTAVLLQSIAWSVVWMPLLIPTWSTVSNSAAGTLQWASSHIPASAEVAVQEGVLGRFADHRFTYILIGAPTTVPVRTSTMYFVVAPGAGQELPVNMSAPLLSDIAHLRGTVLVRHGGGVWVFRYSPKPEQHSVTLEASSTLPAWLLRSGVGKKMLYGPPTGWYVAASGKAGYVAYGDYYREPIGKYTASVYMSSSGPVTIQVWNATAGTLIAQRTVPSTDSPEAITFPLSVTSLVPLHGQEGIAPFSVQPIPPIPGNDIEIRVYTPGGAVVSVYSVRLVVRSRYRSGVGVQAPLT